jgi:hypothetical protein
MLTIHHTTSPRGRVSTRWAAPHYPRGSAPRAGSGPGGASSPKSIDVILSARRVILRAEIWRMEFGVDHLARQEHSGVTAKAMSTTTRAHSRHKAPT